MELLTLVNAVLLLANVAVLGLSVKLYTEFAKERFKGKGSDTPDPC